MAEGRRFGSMVLSNKCDRYFRCGESNSGSDSSHDTSFDKYAESAEEGSFLDDTWTPGCRWALVFWKIGDGISDEDFNFIDTRRIDPRQLVDATLVMDILVYVAYGEPELTPGRVFATGGNSLFPGYFFDNLFFVQHNTSTHIYNDTSLESIQERRELAREELGRIYITSQPPIPMQKVNLMSLNLLLLPFIVISIKQKTDLI